MWFVDYGNAASLPLSDLVEIPSELLKLPALCGPCGLRGVRRPRPEAIHNLHDLVNAKVLVRCHEIDARGAIPKMIVNLSLEGVDVAVRLRNEGYLELEGDDEETADAAAAAPAVDVPAQGPVDLNNNVVVDVNNNVVERRNVDINNNVVADDPSPVVQVATESSDALREENENLRKRVTELNEKVAELERKHVEEIKKMEKKIDTLKSLI